MDDLSSCSDPMYPMAVEYTKYKKVISTSDLQRFFIIGYNRASTLISAMERLGVAKRIAEEFGHVVKFTGQ